MVFLKRILMVYLMVSFMERAYAELPISDVQVNCKFKNDCARYQDELETVIANGISVEKFKEKMHHFLFDKTLKRLNYAVANNESLAKVNIVQNQIVSGISFESDVGVDFSALQRVLPIQEEMVFREGEFEKSRSIIEKYLEGRGYGNAKVWIEKKNDDNLVELLIRVAGGKPVVMKRVVLHVLHGEKTTEEVMRSGLDGFTGKVWDEVIFSSYIEKLKNDLLNRGYVESEVSYEKKQNILQQLVGVTVRISLGEKRHFYFSGNSLFARQELLEAIEARVKSLLGKFSTLELKKTIEAFYKEIGVYGSKINIRKIDGQSLQGIKFVNYYFDIIEGKKLQIAQIHYRGNLLIPDLVLNNLYNKNASVLASRGYLDKEFVEKFTKILRNKYLRDGFIFVDIERPKISINEDEVIIVYEIREGQECLVRKISFNNIPNALVTKFSSVMVNQEKRAFDSQALGEDLKNVIIKAKNEGYYFARIINEDKSSIVKFTSDYSEVTIDVDLQLDKKTVLGQVIVSGNISTKDIVIEREVYIEKGELLPYEDVVEIQKKIAALGLFSTVEITPYVANRESNDDFFIVNLLIRVQEIKFRSVELAPGFRSDLGLKTSLGFNYNNWMGMNRSISLRLQSNWRTNLDELDSRRRSDDKKMLEYSTKLKLSEPYLFGAGIGSNLIFSVTRKRFYGYDADIRRVSSSLNKTLGKISLSLTYRFENIHQFDASEAKDLGTFTIGGVTPSISFDLRDDKANPTKGIFIGLSSEFANPFWGSQKDAQLEVNFIRSILRNKIYFPVGNWITAISLSFGYEKNLAGAFSYIPGIKVFRLTGIDTVRGFQDEEINKLSSGEDISEKIINNTAYFFVMKIEPRYKLSDSTQVGVFYDFGRVYVDKFVPTDVRGAFGISFKFLTPVGSLNFDYGIKTKRYRDSLGAKEGFGRFHLQIGYF